MQQFNYTYEKDNIKLKQYIYNIGSYHYNWHKELELMILLDGEIEVCSDGMKKILYPGDTILINSNKGHATLAHKPDSIAMVLHLHPEFFTDYYENVDYLYFDCQSAEDTRYDKAFIQIRGYLSEMILSQGRDTPEYKLLFKSAFYSLLHTIILNFPPTEVQSSAYNLSKNKFHAINKIIKYIDNNYKKKITLDDLSKISLYNSNYISQLFKSNLGINFYDYLTRIRLREATYELGHTDKTISDIALSNGFPDIKAFNSAFKSNFNKTPSEYRSQLSKDITKIDFSFKEEFISRDNENINNLLMQYVVDKNSYYLDNPKTSEIYNHNEIIESVKQMYELSQKIGKIGKELKITKEDLDKIIWSLSE